MSTFCRQAGVWGRCRLRGVASGLSVAVALSGALTARVEAQDEAKQAASSPQVETFEPVTPSLFAGDLRDLPLAPAWQPGNPILEIPKLDYRQGAVVPPGPPANPTFHVRDPLLDVQASSRSAGTSRAFTTPDLNFAGQGFTGVNPPDTVGDVGTNYYIQMVNSAGGSLLTVYNKIDGSIASGPTALDSLGTGACASGRGDPIVLFDQLADRWLLTEFSAVANRLCVYVSQTNDPIGGGWFNYEFSTPSFPDYPKYGVWPDAYYVSSNESSPAAYALDRNQMLVGAPASSQRFTAPDLAGFGFQALIPSDVDGATPPPVGSPNYFMRHRDDEVHNGGSNDPTQDFLEIWEYNVDFVTPANSTFSGPINIPIAEIDSDLCGLFSFNCFPQPDNITTLDPLREVIMWRLAYRNFGTHETLVGNLVTDVDGTDHGGIRWFELRKIGAGPWTLFQEGTYAPDAEHRFMGSIAMDGAGNVALGYSISSVNVRPGIRYTGRQSTDPLGTMTQPETTIFGGLGSSSSNRWGDYTAMSVDPSDDCTFWYTNQYATAGGTWSTQIASFVFESCGCEPIDPPTSLVATANGPNQIDLSWTASPTPGVTGYDVFRAVGSCPQTTELIASGIIGTNYSDTTVSGEITYAYQVAATDNTVGCSSDLSGCDDALATGTCFLPPDFAGLGSVTSAGSESCTLDLTWNAVTANCGSSVVYNVYRSTSPGFTPGGSTLRADCLNGTTYNDVSVDFSVEYFYVVRAEDASGNGSGPCGGGNQDANIVEWSGIAAGPTAVSFEDNMESGTSNWTPASGPNDGGGTSPWAITTTDSNSPAQSWFISDEDSVKDEMLLTAAPFSIPGTGAILEFWHRFDTESGFDGGVLEFSTNGGVGWFDILVGNATRFLEGEYNDTLSTGASNPLPGRDAWSGSNGGFTRVRVDLADFAGKTLLLRWRFGCDSSVPGVGWWLDDVAVITPTACTTVLCSSTCGDINGSGDAVNLVDFATFVLCFNQPPSSSPGCACSDLNMDDSINLVDFATFSLTFGGASTNVTPNCP